MKFTIHQFIFGSLSILTPQNWAVLRTIPLLYRFIHPSIGGSQLILTGVQDGEQRNKSSSLNGKPGHQEFQVPKMEGFLNLMFGYFGGGFSRIHKPHSYSLYDGFRMNPPFGWYLSEMFGKSEIHIFEDTVLSKFE